MRKTTSGANWAFIQICDSWSEKSLTASVLCLGFDVTIILNHGVTNSVRRVLFYTSRGLIRQWQYVPWMYYYKHTYQNVFLAFWCNDHKYTCMIRLYLSYVAWKKKKSTLRLVHCVQYSTEKLCEKAGISFFYFSFDALPCININFFKQKMEVFKKKNLRRFFLHYYSLEFSCIIIRKLERRE